jgi:hypothetical protein
MQVAPRTKISPPELARRWGLDAHKILGWIRNGELRAIDVSSRQGGRPRYLIDMCDIRIFELHRAVGGPVQAPRRRRTKQSDLIEFF